jgi:hypothetical protein
MPNYNQWKGQTNKGEEELKCYLLLRDRIQ